jgi:PAS domain S-box-containing protein
MSKLRILHLEDSPLDAELTCAALVDADLECDVVRVETQKQFAEALEQSEFDLILSDFVLPGFSGIAALEMARQKRPDLPFIFVSGALGEELAIESLKNGATDYVLKQRLQRLVPSVRRAIEERSERQRRRKAEELLDQSEQRYKLLVDELRDYAIVMLDLSGNVISWNNGARRILGYSDEEILGKSAAVFFTPEDRQDNIHLRELSTAAAEGRSVDERWHVRKDGSQFFASGVTTSLRDQSGTLVGFAKVMRDVTDKQQLEERRAQLLLVEQNARKEAELANRTKDEFLATLSHELRTPLNAILGWAIMLRSGRVGPEDMTEGLSVIERNAKVQAQLIEDLLDISRIISGKMRLHPRPTVIQECIHAAVESVRLAASAKNIDLRIEMPEERFIVAGDPGRLQQIMWNLLSNAVKFTPQSGTVAVRAERGESSVTVSVSDTGMGIAPDFLPFVFDRFRQADGTTRRAHGGLGLGLAIVRHLSELHGGSVRAESEGAGQGATFFVSLPLSGMPIITDVAASDGDGSEHRSLHADSLTTQKVLDGLMVLVVDDEPDARRLLRAILNEAGADVCIAASVPEAIGCCQSQTPDVVVSDIAMPGEDGYALVSHLRRDPSCANVPALALTAFAGRDDQRKAIATGFNRHMAKPVTPRELIHAVAALAGRAVPAQNEQTGIT